MPAVFAAAASPSMSAPFSVGWRRFDRREPELLDLGHGFRLRGAAAGDGCFQPREVRDAGDRLLGHLLRAGGTRSKDRHDEDDEREA
jgi:hypothetical protein